MPESVDRRIYESSVPLYSLSNELFEHNLLWCQRFEKLWNRVTLNGYQKNNAEMTMLMKESTTHSDVDVVNVQC